MSQGAAVKMVEQRADGRVVVVQLIPQIARERAPQSVGSDPLHA